MPVANGENHQYEIAFAESKSTQNMAAFAVSVKKKFVGFCGVGHAFLLRLKGDHFLAVSRRSMFWVAFDMFFCDECTEW